LAEVLDLHRRVMEQAGGSPAVRDLGGLISAVAQPRVTLEGHDLHLVDGNKRAGHAAMETFLVMNGYEVVASVDESEQCSTSRRAALTGNAWQPSCRHGSSLCSGRVATQPNNPLQPAAGSRCWNHRGHAPAAVERER
jgi:death on curing protein